jgi:NH3-dependent NAD+ synthetase
MGITYRELDCVLATIEMEDTAEIDSATLEKVQGMVARSTHKRAMPPIFRQD